MAVPGTTVEGQVTIVGSADAAEGIQQEFTIIPGETYTIRMDVTALSGQWVFLVEDAPTETRFRDIQYLNAAGTYYYTFRITSTSAG